LGERWSMRVCVEGCARARPGKEGQVGKTGVRARARARISPLSLHQLTGPDQFLGHQDDELALAGLAFAHGYERERECVCV